MSRSTIGRSNGSAQADARSRQVVQKHARSNESDGAATKAQKFAPRALNAHALFGMALLPLFLLQPVLGSMLMRPGASANAVRAYRWHGRVLEAGMRAVGVENTRSRDLVAMGFNVQVELVDITTLLVAAVPLVLWVVYALPRQVLACHPAKLWTATSFLGLPLLAVVAQAAGR